MPKRSPKRRRRSIRLEPRKRHTERVDRPDLDRLHAAFLEVAQIDDPLVRGLEAAAIVSDAVRDLGVRLVVYGGAAVSLYTAGAYVSGDVDAALATDVPGVEDRLRALGLEKVYRHWVLPGSDRVVMEFPSGGLEPGWETDTIELDSGRAVEVVTIEDIILDRVEGLSARVEPSSSISRRSCCANRRGSTASSFESAQLHGISSASTRFGFRLRATRRTLILQRFPMLSLRPVIMGSAPMATRLQDILAQAPEMRAAQAALEDRCRPYRRLRPRDLAKAQALRRMGTPERLVGPNAQNDADLLSARVLRASSKL